MKMLLVNLVQVRRLVSRRVNFSLTIQILIAALDMHHGRHFRITLHLTLDGNAALDASRVLPVKNMAW